MGAVGEFCVSMSGSGPPEELHQEDVDGHHGETAEDAD